MAVFSLFWHEQDRGGGADECGTEMGMKEGFPQRSCVLINFVVQVELNP